MIDDDIPISHADLRDLFEGAGCDCEVIFNTAPEWEEIVGYEPPDDTE